MHDDKPGFALSEAEIALRVLDQTLAIVAYIDKDLTYRFANSAYLDWFGRSRAEMMHMTMPQVLGPIFELNLPYVKAVLNGETAVFERDVKIANGTVRHGLMTYKPDLLNGQVQGFFVHVADVTPIKKIEHELLAAKQEAEEVAKRELLNLKQTNATLADLGTIGQEITGYLQAEAITNALNQHIQRLLDVGFFELYLLDHERQLLRTSCGKQKTLALSDAEALPVRCALTRQEIHINLLPTRSAAGTMLSQMYAPLLIGDRILGVMSVQAPQEQAYREREQLIFRALCAYGAVALDNARAYQQLQDAQMQLVAQEKLAALGSLVAGVAHELNTPIGNSLLIATTMEMETQRFAQKIGEQNLRRSELENFIKMANESVALITRGLTNASDLVSSFKQVAVDRTNEKRRIFNLSQTGREIVATMMGPINAGEHSIEIDIPDNITMDSYPGPLGQVISNLINNALLHAFDGKIGGNMTLSAKQELSDRIEIKFQDDGKGIASHHLTRIFEPFFTTKMGKGGNGLGLNISYNIVTSILNGDISVESRPNAGTTFTLHLPVKALANN